MFLMIFKEKSKELLKVDEKIPSGKNITLQFYAYYFDKVLWNEELFTKYCSRACVFVYKD